MSANVLINKVYLGLGSNLGNREELMQQALTGIEQRIGTITKRSSMHTTVADGFTSDNLFLNCAICVETSLSAQEVLSITQQLERELGRTHKSINLQYTDRCMDIDILYFNMEQITQTDLVVPHPRMHQRWFVLAPLCEIAPKLKHPILGQSTQQLLNQLPH